jgi:hypothetical protein
MNSEKMDEIRKRLLLMGRIGYANASSKAVVSNVQEYNQPQDLRQHDWGAFGTYEYLGPGTPAVKKTRQGIAPRNEIDRIAQQHDLEYSRTADIRLGRSQVRAVSDFGAGSAMMVQSANPFTDLDWDERALGFLAGAGLAIQGTARAHPLTMPLMVIVDWVFY